MNGQQQAVESSLPTDKRLIEQLIAGDENAFDQLYSRYKSSLYFYLNVRCNDVLIANDIFQDTWETVLRSIQRYTDSGQFKAWLFSIARSRLIDYYRKQPNQSLVVDLEDSNQVLADLTDKQAASTETLAELFGQTDKLLQCMAVLPAEQQEAMSLYAVGLSVSEIAEITGVNKETAKSRVRYARAKLTHQMQPLDRDSR